jgi:glutaredoxin
MAQPIIKLFTRTMCGWCDDAKTWFDTHGFEFENVDIGLDRQAQEEMLRISGQARVPTVVINGEVLADFDSGQLEAFFVERGLLEEKGA